VGTLLLDPPAYAADELARLDCLIDWQQASLAAARALRAAGDLPAALDLVAAALRARLRAQPCPYPQPPLGDSVAIADLALEGFLSLHGSAPVRIGRPIDWFTRLEVDNQWTIHLCYMYWLRHVARAHALTGRDAYALYWLETVEDFLGRRAYGVPALRYSPAVPPAELDLRTCNNGESHGGGDPWISLSCHARVDNWLGDLATLADHPALTAPRLLRILAALATDHVHVMLANPRENTPNQFLAVALSLLRVGLVLPELRAATPAFLVGHARLLRALDNVQLPDGSDLEQSFNYNANLVRHLLVALETLGPAAPARLRAPLLAAARRRARFLACVVTPARQLPPVGKLGPEAFAPALRDWAVRLALPELAAVADAAPEPGPPAKIVFPHGGYAVLRDHWGTDADWLLFKFSAHGIGHMHEDALSLRLTAAGRDVVVDSGNYSYTDQTPLDAAMNAYGWSSRAHATVLVDGHGQSRLALRAHRPWAHDEAPALRASEQAPVPHRALSGPGFELLQAAYADGHGPEASLQIRHHRSVVRIHGLGWLVLDELALDRPRPCTQVWPLDVRFAGRVVASPEGAARAETDDAALTLLPLCPSPVTTTVLEGVEGTDPRPAAGWRFPAYGKRVPAPDLHFTWTPSGPRALLATLVLPRALATAPSLSAAHDSAHDTFSAEAELPGPDGFTLALRVSSGPGDFELMLSQPGRPTRRLVVRGDATHLREGDPPEAPQLPLAPITPASLA
jgi:hypothetical protein